MKTGLIGREYRIVVDRHHRIAYSRKTNDRYGRDATFFHTCEIITNSVGPISRDIAANCFRAKSGKEHIFEIDVYQFAILVNEQPR